VDVFGFCCPDTPFMFLFSGFGLLFKTLEVSLRIFCGSCNCFCMFARWSCVVYFLPQLKVGKEVVCFSNPWNCPSSILWQCGFACLLPLGKEVVCFSNLGLRLFWLCCVITGKSAKRSAFQNLGSVCVYSVVVVACSCASQNLESGLRLFCGSCVFACLFPT
jgi:hypothetical protein